MEDDLPVSGEELCRNGKETQTKGKKRGGWRLMSESGDLIRYLVDGDESTVCFREKEKGVKREADGIQMQDHDAQPIWRVGDR